MSGTAWSNQLQTFSDADGDALTYSLSGLPPGLSFDPGTRTLSGIPTTAGTYTITYTASDAYGGTTSASFQFQVTALPPVNQAPVVPTPIYDQWSMWNRNWSFTVPANTFYDPNGDTLTYTASNMPTGMSFNATTRTFSMYTPKSTLGFVYNNITITAHDGRGGSVSDSFQLAVEPWETMMMAPVSDEMQSFVAESLSLIHI